MNCQIKSELIHVKTAKPGLTDEKLKEARIGISNEAEYLKELEHRNVISIVHTFEYQNTVALVMPLASGDLSNYLRKHSGRLSKRMIIRLIIVDPTIKTVNPQI